MLIGPRVVLCANTEGTTLVFTGSSEKAFETALSKSRRCHNMKLPIFWHRKNHSRTTDKLKLAGQDIAGHFWKSFRKNL
jgi:hypothetical protein